jgi:hypothetical protein
MPHLQAGGLKKTEKSCAAIFGLRHFSQCCGTA